MKTIVRKFTWNEYEEDIKPFLGYSDESPIKKWVVAPNHGDVVGDIISNSDKTLCCCFVNEMEEPIHIKPEEFVINETVFEEGDIISHIHGHYILIYGEKTSFGFSTIASISSNDGEKWDFDVEIGAEVDEGEFRLATDEETKLLMKFIDDNGYEYYSDSHKIISLENEYCVLRDSEPSERVCLEMTVVKCYDGGLNIISSTYGDENFDKDTNDIYVKSVWAVVIDGKLTKHTDFSPLSINKKPTKLEDGTVLVDKTNGRLFVYSHSRDKQKMHMEFDTNKLWVVADYTITNTNSIWYHISTDEPYDLAFDDIFRRENLEIARPYEVDAIYNAIIRTGYRADKDGNKIINISYNRDKKIKQ